jgi:hypothetical protein
MGRYMDPRNSLDAVVKRKIPVLDWKLTDNADKEIKHFRNKTYLTHKLKKTKLPCSHVNCDGLKLDLRHITRDKKCPGRK